MTNQRVNLNKGFMLWFSHHPLTQIQHKSLLESFQASSFSNELEVVVIPPAYSDSEEEIYAFLDSSISEYVLNDFWVGGSFPPHVAFTVRDWCDSRGVTLVLPVSVPVPDPEGRRPTFVHREWVFYPPTPLSKCSNASSDNSLERIKALARNPAMGEQFKYSIKHLDLSLNPGITQEDIKAIVNAPRKGS